MVVILVCWLSRKLVAALGQPEFIGDILAGVLVGPHLLGTYLPEIFPFVDLLSAVELLQGLSEVGLIWILIEIGWRVSSLDNGALSNRSILVMAFFSITVPFFVGMLLGYWSVEDLASSESALGYVLFCGIALSVTALPVLALIIERSKYISQSVGGTALATAIYTDAFAWIMLSVVVGFWGKPQGEDSSFLLRATGLTSFLLVAIIFRAVTLRLNLRAESSRPGEILIIFLFVLLCAGVTHGLGFHYSIGVIVAVFTFGDIKGIGYAWEKWEGNLRVVMVPIFFIGTGAMISFSGFESRLWIWLVIFVIAAVASKVMSSFVSGIILNMERRDSLVLGVLMSTKGTAELVVLSVGHSSSLLSDDSYNVLLLLSVVSTLLTLPLLSLLNKFQHGGVFPIK
nr:cation:proton antiporter [Pseudomonas sp. CM25]